MNGITNSIKISTLLKKGGAFLDLNNCIVDKIIYHNPENLYTVARLRHGQESVVAVFNDRCNTGEKLNITGNWINHQKYGKQFKVEHIERSTELTPEEVSTVLQNIKGIGPARAEAIISQFGTKALEMAQENPEAFKEILPEKIIENIKEEFREGEFLNKLKRLLLPLGLTNIMIRKIYKQYGEESMKVLQKNPYKLADDIKGIGYKKADEIALKLGINPKDNLRVTACIEYVLKKQASLGHVYLTREELLPLVLEETKQTLATPQILQCIKDNTNLIKDGERIYLKYLYRFEKKIAEKLYKLQQITKIDNMNIERVLEEIEKRDCITYTQQQKEAIKKAFKHGVSIITGGPGTGKTTIIKAIIEIAQKKGLKIELAAPTGKAAKRMEEVTGHPAKTIHRLLEYKPIEDRDECTMEFERNEENPIDADLIIIDEVSMIDTVLMYYLIKAISGTVVFIGDQDQLPSIGAGNVLYDMIETLPTTKLDVIFRQKEMSAIITNSSRINKGLYPCFNNKDFRFYEYESPQQILELYIKELQTGDEVQILTPVKKSETGTVNLNKIIQAAINPARIDKPQITYKDKVFRVGDRVMQQVNDYDKECFNGDTGIIKNIFKDQEENVHAVVDYQGREVIYTDEEIDDLMLAYAITIHKAQGAQFDTVIIPLTTSHYIMLKRNLIYTAVTRAVKKVIIIGQKKAIMIAAKTIDSTKRNTSLGEQLQSLLAEQVAAKS
jgi:exodeoxyribonuclease V alpha subunit